MRVIRRDDQSQARREHFGVQRVAALKQRAYRRHDVRLTSDLGQAQQTRKLLRFVRGLRGIAHGLRERRGEYADAQITQRSRHARDWPIHALRNEGKQPRQVRGGVDFHQRFGRRERQCGGIVVHQGFEGRHAGGIGQMPRGRGRDDLAAQAAPTQGVAHVGA